MEFTFNTSRNLKKSSNMIRFHLFNTLPSIIRIINTVYLITMLSVHLQRDDISNKLKLFCTPQVYCIKKNYEIKNQTLKMFLHIHTYSSFKMYNHNYIELQTHM